MTDLQARADAATAALVDLLTRERPYACAAGPDGTVGIGPDGGPCGWTGTSVRSASAHLPRPAGTPARLRSQGHRPVSADVAEDRREIAGLVASVKAERLIARNGG